MLLYCLFLGDENRVLVVVLLLLCSSKIAINTACTAIMPIATVGAKPSIVSTTKKYKNNYQKNINKHNNNNNDSTNEHTTQQSQLHCSVHTSVGLHNGTVTKEHQQTELQPRVAQI